MKKIISSPLKMVLVVLLIFILVNVGGFIYNYVYQSEKIEYLKSDNKRGAFEKDTNVVDIEIGSVAKTIEGKTLKGIEINTDSMRGDLVLIQFWASWCSPCRSENPELKEIYSLYKDFTFPNGERFKILSVSVDANLDNWENAIEEDKLNWDLHICEGVEWEDNETSNNYNIKSIPHLILLNKNGVIIGNKLLPNEVKEILEEYKNNNRLKNNI